MGKGRLSQRPANVYHSKKIAEKSPGMRATERVRHAFLYKSSPEISIRDRVRLGIHF